MKTKRFLSFLLVAAMLVSALALFASCGEKSPDGPTPGPEGDMTFGGKTLVVSISKNQDNQTTFPAADIYTMGPDKSKGNVTDSVQKKVLKRNDAVAKELDIKVEYQTTDLTYDLVAPEVDKIIMTSADDAPDIFNNDIYGLTRSMMAGQLYNVKNPADEDGNPIKSYFNFKDDGWYHDYMNGATFDQDKLFILAGDYFIDIIRFAWVLFVNKQLFDAAYADTIYGTYEDVCNQADLDDWTYEDLIALARMGLVDAPGGNASKADENDTRVPMYLNNLSPRVFFYGSGVSVVKWDSGKFGKGTPSIIASTGEQMDNLITLSERYSDLFNATGVYYKDDVKASTSQFMKGNIIMSMCELGEMESEEMRKTGLSRGILPFPTYLRNSSIHTVVHDQAEIGVILATTNEFTMASAYMQKLNEESADVLKDYYENSLKFKYSEGDEATLTMIDKVHDTIDSPFDGVIVPYLCGLIENGSMTYQFFQNAAENQSSNFRAQMTSQIPQLQGALDTVLENYKKKVV